MPNGDPDFDPAEMERYFSPVAKAIEEFARRHNLLLDRYYHDSPSWSLRFNHPKGGQASISVIRGTEERVKVDSVWHLDDYDRFTRNLHWRELSEVPRNEAAVREALREEFRAILAVELGDWNRVVDGYKGSWGRYSKAEFEAMGPRYPDPILDEDA